MVIDRISERFLSVYLLITGVIAFQGLDIFFKNSQFLLMDTMYLIFHSLFIVAGIMGVFFERELLTRFLVYMTLFTITISGFNYLLTGTLSFVVGIYFKKTLLLVSDYRSYGGFSFYFSPEESDTYGIGINLTSLLLITYYHLRKRFLTGNGSS